MCTFLKNIYVLLFLLALWNGNTLARVIGEHLHFYSVRKYIADEVEMMNGCLSRQRFAVFQALAVKCKIIDKLLDMTVGDLVKSEMSDSRIHSNSELFHTLIGSLAEIELCVLFKPLLGEVLKLDIRSNLTFRTLVHKRIACF